MLSTAEARALITTSLSDSDLGDVISREEAWLARRIGPLEGERVETFASVSGTEGLRLSRPTDAVTVEDEAGPMTAVEVVGWGDVILDPDSGRGWNGDVQVTYTPSDSEEVKRALVTLLRLTLAESGYASQSAGGYSVATDVDAQAKLRYRAWRSLLRPRQASSLRILGSGATAALAPISIVASGS